MNQLEPGQSGYNPRFVVVFRFDEWFLERLNHERVYEPGECRKGTQCSFGWKDDDTEAAKQWLIRNDEKNGIALANVELVSIGPWK
jgi:hypothetical protein